MDWLIQKKVSTRVRGYIISGLIFQWQKLETWKISCVPWDEARMRRVDDASFPFSYAREMLET